MGLRSFYPETQTKKLKKQQKKSLKKFQTPKKIPNFAAQKPRWRNGRRARFRCECCEACRFESCSGHYLNLQVIEIQLLAIFYFNPCQRGVTNLAPTKKMTHYKC